MAAIGTSRAPTMRKKNAFEPRNRKRANPEPAPRKGRAGGRAAAAEHCVQHGVAEPLEVGTVIVDVLEEQREVMEELEWSREPEAERAEQVGLGFRRVNDDPDDRSQGEYSEKGAQRSDQWDRAALQPVQMGGYRGVPFFEPFPPTSLAPGLGAAGGGFCSVGRRECSGAHASSPLWRRKAIEPTETAMMASARTTAMAAPRLYWELAIEVL